MTIRLPGAPSPRVSIIIPSAGRLDLLRACLGALARHGPDAVAYETIVVLNRANADLAHEVRSLVDGIAVIHSPVNLGLAGAGNRGRALARGELLTILHDDAEIEPGWMEALVAVADAHPEAGAIGGKVLNPDGSLQDAGLILWHGGYTSQAWVDGATPGPDAFETVRAVDYCGTSALMVRAALWDRIGGLDERFHPVYFVDVDLGMAIRQLGRVVLYAPRARIRHRRGASGSVAFRHFVNERNRRRFVAKWGTVLDAHEAPAHDRSEAIARAFARAEATAASCRSRLAPLTDAMPRLPFDSAEQDRRLAAASLEVEAEFAVMQAKFARRRRWHRRLWQAIKGTFGGARPR